MKIDNVNIKREQPIYKEVFLLEVNSREIA